MTEEFTVPDMIPTTRGLDNIALIALTREIQKLQRYLFENPDTQFNKTVQLIDIFLKNNNISDSKLQSQLEDYLVRINKLHSRFTSLELDMFLLKNDLIKFQMDYEKTEGNN